MRVSLPWVAGGGRIRVVLAALCALLALAFVATAATPSAHASFTLEKCEGGEIEGEGSSLQKLAQLNWISQIFDTKAYGGCGASAPKVKFTTASSGCGLDAMGAGTAASGCSFSATEQKIWEKAGYRDGKVRFGAADFAPDPEEETHINDGLNGAGNAGSGTVHVIPVAGAAITVVVHFPNGCALQNPAQTGGNGNTSTGGFPVPEEKAGEVKAGEEDRNNDPSGGFTKDKFANQTIRVHISDQKLEEAWQGHLTTWGQLVPEADFLEKATNGVTKTKAECAATPIVRIVRQDTSGTTYNFKHFLALLPSFNNEGGTKLWTSGTSQVGNTNTAWPIESATKTGVPTAVEASNECKAAEHICHALEGSGGSLSNAVIATNGSFGYLDMATAREKGYNMTPNSTGEPGKAGFEETKNDRLYWIPLQPVEPPANESSAGKVDESVFIEPTVEPTSHFNGGAETKGANCAGADWRGYPTRGESPNGDPTLADWSKAIATGNTEEAVKLRPTTAYPVCALTYDLAFDDNATAYGNTPEEEKAARTVKDYLSSVVSDAGQFGLPAFDYAALPNEIVEDAQTGVAAIGWNKTAGSGGGGGGVGNGGGSGGSGGTGTPAPTPLQVVPSNAFSVAGAKVKGKSIVLSLVLPDPGKVQIKATGDGVTVANVTASVKGGSGSVTLSISKAALTKLAKVKGHKFSVKITITFTPTGGSAASKTKTITLTESAVAPPKKKASKKGKK